MIDRIGHLNIIFFFLISGMMESVGDSGPLKADGTPDMRFSANQ